MMSLLAASLVALPVHAKPNVHGPYQLAPGVKLWRVRYPTPLQVRVLRINPAVATIDVVAGGEEFGSISPVSEQAVTNGAIAAVNGDFGTLKGQPTHPNMIDAALHTSGLQAGSTFSVAVGGARAWAKQSTLSVEATSPAAEFKVWRFNAGEANHHHVVAWSAVGGGLEHPVTDMCAARLVPAGPFRWSDGSNSGVARSFTVEEQPDPCSFGKMEFTNQDEPGTVILQAPRDCTCAKRVEELELGEVVDLAWSTKGRHATTDLIGGQPQLVRAGKNVAPGASTPGYFYNENPRTGVGITKGCSDADVASTCYVYFITVDGRAQGWSQGMTLTRFALEFLRQSPPAYYAFNLDGGGASEMWVSTESSAYCQIHPPAGGCTVNKPSDGHERSAISTLQVLAGPDPDEPI
jgi:hypothetical protein